MYTNIEFLSAEPIENVITSMKFKMDKTIYFGYPEVIQDMKEKTSHFLKKYCGVETVEYISVSRSDLQATIDKMRTIIQKEKNNEVFFDITGGESLILIAFGILSKELNLPMHMFDVEKDELIELTEVEEKLISKKAISQNISLNIEKYIEMQGGVINYRMQKDMKNMEDPMWKQKIQDIWKVSKKHLAYWNSFAALIRNAFRPDDYLQVSVSEKSIKECLHKNRLHMKMTTIQNVLRDLEEIQLIQYLRVRKGIYTFKYVSEEAKDMLWDGGSILELYTYLMETSTADDCKVGVHLDWDGEIQKTSDQDVVNEIDVLSLRGNTMTFISCKNGKMESTRSLQTLYEIDAVASQFGGKYVKKAVAITRNMPEACRVRAKEMGIEVKIY